MATHFQSKHEPTRMTRFINMARQLTGYFIDNNFKDFFQFQFNFKYLLFQSTKIQ